MKAKPVILDNGTYVESPIEKATHVKLNLPGPTGIIFLPIMLKGTRKGTYNWTWNGDTEKPTLKPSVRTKGGNNDGPWICHSWINDGKITFLPDSTHELTGKTIDLLDVE